MVFVIIKQIRRKAENLSNSSLELLRLFILLIDNNSNMTTPRIAKQMVECNCQTNLKIRLPSIKFIPKEPYSNLYNPIFFSNFAAEKKPGILTDCKSGRRGLSNSKEEIVI